MTTIQTPAKARSDAAQSPTTTTRVGGGTATRTDRPYLRHGRMLTAGALTWALGFVFLGNGPEDDVLHAVYFGTALVFQAGLLALLRVLWRSRAIGQGRVARTALRIEAGLIGLAMVSTVSDAFQVSDLDQVGWALLDACWPISMLGMFFIGIRIAIAGRWNGVYRFWPMVAESWALVVIPSMVVLGQGTASHVIAPLHLVVGYGVLGVLVSRKTD